MNDALANLYEAIEKHKPALLGTLHLGTQGNVSHSASVRTLVRLARATGATAPLHTFETAIRPALVDYVASRPKGDLRHVDPTAQFLIEHFDQFTEVPITASFVNIVLSWVRRNYRAWRKGQ